METTRLTERIKTVAQAVEKFVEHNLIEKEQRDENFRKLALAFETFVQRAQERSGDQADGKQSDQRAEMSFDKRNVEPGVRVAVKVHEHFKGDLPEYQSPLASGFDVRAQLSQSVSLEPGQRALVPTGLSFSIPMGYEIQARPRSGWAIRDGVTLLNTPGTIDADYRGEVKIILINLGQSTVTIHDQDRIAQLVLSPVCRAHLARVESLDETERGDGGFGSTGR